MLKRFIPILLLAPLTALAVGQQFSNIDLPKRGTLKSNVETTFGGPNRIIGPVGDPPISQWIYDQFTVVFEYNHVVHAFTRDFNIENRPQSEIPHRPDLTLPSSSNSITPSEPAVSDSITNDEPEPILIDDSNEDKPKDQLQQDTTTDEASEPDSVFDSEPSDDSEPTEQTSEHGSVFDSEPSDETSEFDTVFDSEPSDEISEDEFFDPQA